ncbi:MAG TPA: hypothetical protein H9965_00675 [Candidatus Streptococcus faecavium]|uniref:Uncharacterized protein n=1 Tax=Candidatus Streptococcus faecavium TaxID=2838763 RepID=A0A9D2FUK3_9STRE|nr:hypothetical protein [Candidatus Streptococcus faecavium]
MQNLSERSLLLMSIAEVTAIIAIVVSVIFGTLSLVIQIIGLILSNSNHDKKK